MNPLTLVKRIQKINSQEASLGISEEASWHAKYKESAYVFVGGIPYDLTEGDLLAVFAQYGEIVDVNLVRDKGTGKSKGFAFVAYEDQRSTILAVDNLNGAQILGRVIRVDHVSNYKKKEEEDEAEEQKKREERGVCRAFQKGECTRGAGCKFSHDEQRAANTGWGAEDQKGKWGHDRFDGPERSEKKSGSRPQVRDAQRSDKDEKRSRRHADDDREPGSRGHLDRREDTKLRRLDERETSPPTSRGYEGREGSRQRRYNDEHRSREISDRREDKRSRRSDYDDFEPRPREGSDRRDNEPRSREGRNPREEKRSTKQEPESYSRGYEDRKVESRSARDRDLSSHHR